MNPYNINTPSASYIIQGVSFDDKVGILNTNVPNKTEFIFAEDVNEIKNSINSICVGAQTASYEIVQALLGLRENVKVLTVSGNQIRTYLDSLNTRVNDFISYSDGPANFEFLSGRISQLSSNFNSLTADYNLTGKISLVSSSIGSLRNQFIEQNELNDEKYATKNDVAIYLSSEIDPIFSNLSSQFSLQSDFSTLTGKVAFKTDLSSLLSTELDPVFSNLSSTFVKVDDFETASSQFVLESDLEELTGYFALSSDVESLLTNYVTINALTELSSEFALTSDIESLNIRVSDLEGITGTFATKDELTEFINSSDQFALKDDLSAFLTGEIDPLFAEQSANFVSVSEFQELSTGFALKEDLNAFLTGELDPVFSEISSGFITDLELAALSTKFALTQEITSLISSELDPVFAEMSSQFATKAEVSSLLSTEMDPIFAELSSKFALSSNVSASFNQVNQRLTDIEGITGTFLASEEFAETSSRFTENSMLSALTSQFVLSADLSGELSSIHETIAQIQANSYDDTELRNHIEAIEDTLSGTSAQFALSSDVLTGFNAVYEAIELSAYDDSNVKNRLTNLEAVSSTFATTELLSLVSGTLATKEEISEFISNELDPIFAVESSRFALSSDLSGELSAIHETISQIQANSYDDTELRNHIEAIKDTLSGTSGQFALNSDVLTSFNQVNQRLTDIEGVTGTFLTGDDIKSLLSTEIDPLFAAASSEFVLSSNISGELSSIHETIAQIQANGYDDTELREGINSIEATSSGFATKQEINAFLTGELDPVFSDISGDFITDLELAALSTKFALEEELSSLISSELDPVFAGLSSKFALSADVSANFNQVDQRLDDIESITGTFLTSEDIESFLSTEIDPKFAEASAQFVLSSNISGELSSIHETIAQIQANGYDDTELRTKINNIEDILSGTSGQFALSSDVLTSYNLTDQRLNAIESVTASFLTEELEPLFTEASSKFVENEILSALTGQFALSADLSGELNSIHETITQIQANGYDDTELRTRINDVEDTLSGTSGQFALSSDVLTGFNQVNQRLDDIEGITGTFLTSDDIELFLVEEIDPKFAEESAKFVENSTLSALTSQFALSADLSDELSSIHETISQIQANGYDDTELRTRIGSIEDTLSGTSGQFALSSDMITGFTAVYETIELSAYDDTELRTRINGIDDTLSGTSGQFALKNDLNSYLSAETDPIFKAESGNFALTSTITTINERLNTIDAILSSDFSDVVDMLDELQQKLDNLS